MEGEWATDRPTPPAISPAGRMEVFMILVTCILCSVAAILVSIRMALSIRDRLSKRPSPRGMDINYYQNEFGGML